MAWSWAREEQKLQTRPRQQKLVLCWCFVGGAFVLCPLILFGFPSILLQTHYKTKLANSNHWNHHSLQIREVSLIVSPRRTAVCLLYRSPKKFNTLHRRVLGMEYFPIRFKISIRDLKCKKMQKCFKWKNDKKCTKSVLNEKMIKMVKTC